LLARDPTDEKYKLDVASTKVILAELAGDSQVHDEQLEHIASMMPIVRKMLADDPQSPRRQRDLAFGLRIVAELKVKRGQIEEALRDLDEAAALQEKILRSDPENVIVQDEVAKTLAQQGTTAQRAGKLPQATKLAGAGAGDAPQAGRIRRGERRPAQGRRGAREARAGVPAVRSHR
jgi:hypothetical protein